jgi:hypothetical protein
MVYAPKAQMVIDEMAMFPAGKYVGSAAAA